MGYDQRAFQMFLNVVAITGLTSLALLWFLRRRDHKQAPANLSLLQEQEPLAQGETQTDEGAKQLAGAVEPPQILHTEHGGEEDIRRYIARRSREWASAAKAN